MKRTWLHWGAIGCGAFFALYAAQAFASGTSGDAIALEARKIEGEVYVKASSLVAALGGKGSFDPSTNTYRYVPGDVVPDVIEQVGDSVVAVIGKPQGSPARASDRFELAHGSGVIVSSDGWIVTNAHVIESMKEIIVLTQDEKQYKPTKVLRDPASDLALLKITATGLQAAKFADSDDIRPGETVIAIGTPVSFSLRNSATVGVVSGVNRSVNGSYRLLQTDAAINPGNSGGPLINTKGEVVGINTLKFVDVSVDNTGFSIPANTVQYIAEHLRTYGQVKRAYLGFELEESWEAVVGLATNKPMTVLWVDPASSAAKLGVKKGDSLYSLNQKKLSTKVDLNEELKHYLPGEKVTVTMLSNGDIVQRTLTLQAHP
ncbi:S1C family serine protease [Paenibacillus sp.]|uniref:S1C family serine protease n=1 Tax=Paenibacillus sp. TaxID=58172 RepID=UPI002D38372F|nr:trypsin-like peptidase domain-containing protein [Paenibacillus sp.]HZG56143.1 trypsin-like peptidase domain-containing protein [Paenibacillus sp.]